MSDQPQDIRWKQRFDNFQKALKLLNEACERGVHSLSRLEQEGVTQRFEYTSELAWKTIKDFLLFKGVNVRPFPRDVIKQAFATEIITDGNLWIIMLEERNKLTHRYDEAMLDKWLEELDGKYRPALNALQAYLKKEISTK